MSNSSNRLAVAIVSLGGFVVVVVVNALATTLPLGGMTTGQLSDLYPNLFVPAGLTFSIWGVIYLLLGIYIVFGMIEAMRAREGAGEFLEKIGVLFIVTCIANAGWIFAWQYRLVLLSLLAMLVLLVSLILIYVRLNVGLRPAVGRTERYMVHLPMSVYLGWITVATIANVTAVLVHLNWNGFGASQQAWAVAMIVVAIALGLIMLFYRHDIFFALVIDWALLGIYIKRTSIDPQSARAVIIVSVIGLGLLTAGVITQLARRKVYR